MAWPMRPIAIVPSAGYGIAVAANNLAIESGEIILVLDDQFPSNFYSWQRLARRSGAEIHVVRKQDEQTCFLRQINSPSGIRYTQGHLLPECRIHDAATPARSAGRD